MVYPKLALCGDMEECRRLLAKRLSKVLDEWVTDRYSRGNTYPREESVSFKKGRDRVETISFRLAPK
jgi:hypothetical protein